MSSNHQIPEVDNFDTDIRDRLNSSSVIKQRSHEQLNLETLVRWQEAEQDKVVSHQEVSQWLDTWGTDEERDRL